MDKRHSDIKTYTRALRLLFITSSVFPFILGSLISLPFGFFTTAILFSNEIPDFNEDTGAGKFTWVSLIGQNNAYIIYYVLAFLGFVSIAVNIIMGYLGLISCISFVFMFLSIKAAEILKKFPQDKLKLMESSQLTMLTQALVSISLILGRIIL